MTSGEPKPSPGCTVRAKRAKKQRVAITLNCRAGSTASLRVKSGRKSQLVKKRVSIRGGRQQRLELRLPKWARGDSTLIVAFSTGPDRGRTVAVALR